MKRYYVVSDLHLEGLVGLCTWQGELRDSHQILENSYLPLFAANAQEHNVLLLAGDFCEARHLHYFLPMLAEAAQRFNYQEIYYIAGNHEYWHKSFGQTESLIRDLIKGHPILSQRMRFLQNEKVVLDDDTLLLAASLWYHLSPADEYPISLRMNDYKRIRGDDFRRLTYPAHIRPRFHESWHFIKKQLESLDKGKRIIIMTHHIIGSAYLKLTPYEDSRGYGSLIPDDVLDTLYKHGDNIIFVHGHSHIRHPQEYVNEYGIRSFCNTVGYWKDEYKGIPHCPLKLPL